AINQQDQATKPDAVQKSLHSSNSHMSLFDCTFIVPSEMRKSDLAHTYTSSSGVSCPRVLTSSPIGLHAHPAITTTTKTHPHTLSVRLHPKHHSFYADTIA